MNWLLQNLERRFRFALSNPRYVTASLFREFTLADERFLSSITGVSPARICSFLNEPLDTRAFAAHLRSVETVFQQTKIEAADLYIKKILAQYAALRAIVPAVVETVVGG